MMKAGGHSLVKRFALPAIIVAALCVLGFLLYPRDQYRLGRKTPLGMPELERVTKIRFPAGSAVKHATRYDGLPYSWIIAQVRLPVGNKTLTEFQAQDRLKDEEWNDDTDHAAAVCNKINAKAPDWNVGTPAKSASFLGRLWDIGGANMLIDLDDPAAPMVEICIEKNE